MNRINYFTIRMLTPEEVEWATSVLIERWSAKLIALRGELIGASK